MDGPSWPTRCASRRSPGGGWMCRTPGNTPGPCLSCTRCGKRRCGAWVCPWVWRGGPALPPRWPAGCGGGPGLKHCSWPGPGRTWPSAASCTPATCATCCRWCRCCASSRHGDWSRVKRQTSSAVRPDLDVGGPSWVRGCWSLPHWPTPWRLPASTTSRIRGSPLRSGSTGRCRRGARWRWRTGILRSRCRWTWMAGRAASRSMTCGC